MLDLGGGVLVVLQAKTTSAKEGKGLVKCVFKSCPTRMQLARLCNQISNNTLLKYRWEVVEVFLQPQ